MEYNNGKTSTGCVPAVSVDSDSVRIGGERNISREEMRVYAVTDMSWLRDKSLPHAVEEALIGGATLIQLRAKELLEDELTKLAVEVRKVTDAYGVKLIVNDSPIAALQSGSAGVHIGQKDMDIAAARCILGPDRVIGVSAHTVEEARRAEAGGADYLGVGAVFATSTKKDASELSPDRLAEICSVVSIPVVAIGGVNADNIRLLKGTGIAGVAVVSAIFAAKDITLATARISAEVEKITAKAIETEIIGLNAEGSEIDDSADSLADGAAVNITVHTNEISSSAQCGVFNRRDTGNSMIGSLKVCRYKAAIFDYDGTIVDSMGMWRSIGSAYARKLGADLSGEEADRKLNEQLRTMSLEESAGLFRRDYGACGTDEEIMAEVLDLMHDNYKYRIECKTGIVDVLEDLRSHGVRLCIATASPREMIESANNRLGLSDYFDAVFSCVEFNTTKRKPDIYFRAAEFLCAEAAETLVFEDVRHAAETAASAGFFVVGVYDAESAEDGDAIRNVSSVYLGSYDEWPGVENLRGVK